MPIDFDQFIKERIVYYNPEFTLDDIISTLVNTEWDIIAFRDTINIKKNIKVPMMYRDVITNVKTNNCILFYNIDGVDIPIRDDTRIITALTPFKPIYIRAFDNNYSDGNKWVKINFTRLLLKNNLINNLRKEIVYDNNFTYHSGELV